MAEMSVSESRPWTFGGRPKKRPNKLKTPQINTYFLQIQKCQELYSKLKLDCTTNKLMTSPFPKIQLRERTFMSLPPTKYKAGNITKDMETVSQRTSSSENIDRMDTDRPHCVRMTPKRLCEYLRSKGFGHPRVYTSSYIKRQNETVINQNPKPFFKMLPKNHSKRSKLKERPGLDNTLANLRVGAFNGKHKETLPTASQGSMRVKDIHFVDRDLRDKLHRNKKGETDNSFGVIRSPLTKIEQLKRIEAWLEGVEKAKNEPSISEPNKWELQDISYCNTITDSSTKIITLSTSEQDNVFS